MIISHLIPNNIITIYANNAVTTHNGTTKINNVRLINQFPELPTGCEATALTMLLQYHGVNVSKKDIANAIPREPLPYYKNGIRYGGNPNKGFIGNPYSNSSYGVFELPILDVINKFLPEQAENLTGKTLDELLTVVKSGRPVMIWATVDMQNVVYRQKWKFSTGETFTWPGKEHALLIVGYDTDHIYLNDPYTGQLKKYKKQVVENRYNTLGKKAVAVLPKKEALTLTVNGQAVDLSTQAEILHKKDSILIPVSHLSYIIDGVSASYRNNMVYLNILDTEVSLDKNKNTVDIVTADEKLIELHYEINNGTTRIDLNSLTELFPITYSIEDNNLLVNIDRVFNVLINNVPLIVEEGKDILLRNEGIFFPISYIQYLTDSFKYSYVNQQVHVQLGNHSYILERDKNNIDILLDDNSTMNLKYLIEDGITRVDFKGLADYLSLNYVIEDSTIFISRPLKFAAIV